MHRLAQPEEGDGFLPRVARYVVVQVQASDRLLRHRILARQLVRVLEEDMSDGVLDARLCQKRQIETGDVGDAKRLRQFKARRVAVGEEDGNSIYQQRARQPVHQRRQHLVEIGLRTQLASEFNQCAPVVVARPEEILVQLLLDPFSHRIEQQRGNYHRDHQPVRSGTGHARVHQLRDRSDAGEVKADDGRRGQRIRHAALEDQIHVHQPVTENGVAKRQRQQSQRQYRHLHRERRHHSEQIRQNIEQRKRCYGKNSAARNPLELLPQNGGGGRARVVPKDGRCRDKENRQIRPVHPIQIKQQRVAGFQVFQRQELDYEQNHSRNVERRNRPAMPADERPPLRKGQYEMQEQRRLQQPRHFIGP